MPSAFGVNEPGNEIVPESPVYEPCNSPIIPFLSQFPFSSTSKDVNVPAVGQNPFQFSDGSDHEGNQDQGKNDVDLVSDDGLSEDSDLDADFVPSLDDESESDSSSDVTALSSKCLKKKLSVKDRF